MPLIVALDEYENAITQIAMHAAVALVSLDAEQREVALQIILGQCSSVSETVEDVLSCATSQAAQIL